MPACVLLGLTVVPSCVQSCSLACNVCLQLARRGFAIVLISRSQDKLDEISKAIGKLFTNPVKMFHLTLSQTDGGAGEKNNEIRCSRPMWYLDFVSKRLGTMLF